MKVKISENIRKFRKEHSLTQDQLNDFIECIRVKKESVIYADRLKAVILIECAYLEACKSNYESAGEYISQAYHVAKEFDKNPIYNLGGIIFCEEEDAEGVAFDDMGKTAVEAVERLIDSEEKDGYLYIRKVWGKLKNEKDVRETVL